jgi:ring-1,2-phenylacetyl-CoA epoxidase subunit PaaC
MNTLNYVLHLADSCLVLAQRNMEWVSNGPTLEEDIAQSNMSLDLLGQSRLLYQYAAQLQANGVTEDKLAYFRSAPEFLNWAICELPHFDSREGLLAATASHERDYATTIARNFIVASFMHGLWRGLTESKDAQLAAIAAKSLKEVSYHLRSAQQWVLRMGDGTDESHVRLQSAFNHLWPYTQELWLPTAHEQRLIEQGVAFDAAGFKPDWDAFVDASLTEATLQKPAEGGHASRGKWGQHTVHLSYLLAEMQSLAREHPEAVW